MSEARKGGGDVDLESLLVSLYVLVDEWWQRTHCSTPRRPGRPPSLSASEVLTLAVLAQWPRFRSERDFFRFADAHLREYFPDLLTYGQLNRRIRALEPELKAFQRDLAQTLADSSEIYHVLDTTLIPAVVRVRACRKGLFAGQATFGRSISKTEWVYGFKVALSVNLDGVVSTVGFAHPPTATRGSARRGAPSRGSPWRLPCRQGLRLRGLREAFTKKQLEKQTELLEGAIMPDGSKHP